MNATVVDGIFGAADARERQARDGESSSAGALPVVDIAPLFRSCARGRRRAAEALGRAAEEHGFLYVEGHGVEDAAIRDVYDEAASWFERPLEEKLRYYIGNSRNHRGYVPRSERGDYADETVRNYEAFDLALDLPDSDPDYAHGHQLLGPNVWPDSGSFRAAVGSYYERMSRIGRVMCEAFETYLRVPAGTLTNVMTKPTSQLRLLHYLENNPAAHPATVNMGAHTDYECFTLLHQRVPGLQVLDRSGRWLDAPPMDGAFAVNLGDLLETWTNGRLRATLHRVRNSGAERFSLPFFVAADYDAVVRPLDNQVAKDEAPDYQAIVAGHHLLGQLLRDFPYLRDRHARGLLQLPFEVPEGNPFEAGRLPLQAAA